MNNNDNSDDDSSREELGAWGVPVSVEDDIDPNAGYPAGLGLPGIFSGNETETESDDTDTSGDQRVSVP